jgi:hypothetical protein
LVDPTSEPKTSNRRWLKLAIRIAIFAVVAAGLGHSIAKALGKFREVNFSLTHLHFGWLAASGFLGFVERNTALAQAASDYKALVCVFQLGGNDGENTLVRFDTAGYQNYASVRSPASNINIPQAQLLPIQAARGGPPFGFHPACGPLQTLFNQRQLAVCANVGILAQPSARAGLESGATLRPANLFSHNDQMLALQSADHRGFTRVGWGGRVADRIEAEWPGTLFPPLTSVNGLQTFVFGENSVPLTVPPNPWFTLFSSGANQFQFDALRDAALREILAQEHRNVYEIGAQLLSEEGLSASSVAFPILQNPASIVPQFFASQRKHWISNAALWALTTAPAFRAASKSGGMG